MHQQQQLLSMKDQLFVPICPIRLSYINRLKSPDPVLGFEPEKEGRAMSFCVMAGCIMLDCTNNGPEKKVSTKLKKNGKNPKPSFRKPENGPTKACSRGHWKPSEDAKLRELVALYGPQNWKAIAENLQGRSGKSCRLRWHNQLDPKINKRDFTEGEEERLMAAHRAYGNKWALISRFFPGRTDNAVKNHWHVLMARKYRQKCKPYFKKKDWIDSCDDDQSAVLERSSSMEESAVITNNPITSLVSGIQNHSGECVSWENLKSGYGKMGGQRALTDFMHSTAKSPAFIDFLGVGINQ